jgi:hypothetical protein
MFAAVSRRQRTLIAAAAANMNRRLGTYRQLIEQRQAGGTALQVAAARASRPTATGATMV